MSSEADGEPVVRGVARGVETTRGAETASRGAETTRGTETTVRGVETAAGGSMADELDCSSSSS